MPNPSEPAPEPTAVRVALWRALHAQIDPKPSVLSDELGLRLVGDPRWRERADMDPAFSKSMRASIVGRARFVEDLVEEAVAQGVRQYVLLGAGLDTFAQRRPELASRLRIFEVDRPGPQAWKKKRLSELGLPTPEGLRFAPVDFEAGESWWRQLLAAGFDARTPAVVVSTGVSMYLTREANRDTFRQLSTLAPSSTFATTFLLPPERLSPAEASTMRFVMAKAREGGTPFLSLFSPQEITELAIEAGFKKVEHVSAEDLYRRYFAGRSDGLNAGSAEAFLVVRT